MPSPFFSKWKCPFLDPFAMIGQICIFYAFRLGKKLPQNTGSQSLYFIEGLEDF
jgi:hypothetical protein